MKFYILPGTKPKPQYLFFLFIHFDVKYNESFCEMDEWYTDFNNHKLGNSFLRHLFTHAEASHSYHLASCLQVEFIWLSYFVSVIMVINKKPDNQWNTLSSCNQGVLIR